MKSELKIQEIISENISAPFTIYSSDHQVLGEQLLAELYTGMTWEVETGSIPESNDTLSSRTITLKSGGISGGRSLKFKNFKLDIANLMTMASGFLITGQNMLDKPKPFVIAAGILLMIGTLLHASTKEISQQEATVFWGFMVAVGHKSDKRAEASSILKKTNIEREKRGLNPLTETQVKYSLTVLEQLGSIAHIEQNTWQIVERFKLEE